MTSQINRIPVCLEKSFRNVQSIAISLRKRLSSVYFLADYMPIRVRHYSHPQFHRKLRLASRDNLPCEINFFVVLLSIVITLNPREGHHNGNTGCGGLIVAPLFARGETD
jgi:hypothetical protein